jgi:hypothetical protein
VYLKSSAGPAGSVLPRDRPDSPATAADFSYSTGYANAYSPMLLRDGVVRPITILHPGLRRFARGSSRCRDCVVVDNTSGLSG